MLGLRLHLLEKVLGLSFEFDFLDFILDFVLPVLNVYLRTLNDSGIIDREQESNLRTLKFCRK